LSDLSQEASGFSDVHNLADLILLRGAGESIDWNNIHVVTEVGTRKICDHHYRELFSEWSRKNFNHINWQRFAGNFEKACTFTSSVDGQKHKIKAVSRLYVSKSDSQAYLLKTGILLQVGHRKQFSN
jgi:hypothetical protein